MSTATCSSLFTNTNFVTKKQPKDQDQGQNSDVKDQHQHFEKRVSWRLETKMVNGKWLPIL